MSKKNTKLDYDKSFKYYIEQGLNEPIEKYWDYNKNEFNPENIRRSSMKNIWIKCQEHNYHGSYLTTANSFSSGKRCPYCVNRKVNYFDSVGFLHHDIAKQIYQDVELNDVNILDTYKLAPQKHDIFYFKCDKCNNITKKRLDYVTTRGLTCDACGDGVPYGEKFISYLLRFSKIRFINQFSKHNEEWCGKYRYDFYLPDHNKMLNTIGYGLLSQLNNNQVNDNQDYRNKKELAISQNIEFIEIPYLYYNKRSIDKYAIEILKDIVDFKNIDLNKIHEMCDKGFVYESSELWLKGNTSLEIAEKLGTCRASAIKYLKKGTKLGLCNYNARREMALSARVVNKEKRKKILCKTTGEIFESQLAAAKAYDISPASIISCCKGRREYGGKIKETGEKLVWAYY